MSGCTGALKSLNGSTRVLPIVIKHFQKMEQSFTNIPIGNSFRDNYFFLKKGFQNEKKKDRKNRSRSVTFPSAVGPHCQVATPGTLSLYFF